MLCITVYLYSSVTVPVEGWRLRLYCFGRVEGLKTHQKTTRSTNLTRMQFLSSSYIEYKLKVTRHVQLTSYGLTE